MKVVKIALPLLLLLAVGAYKFVLAKPAEAGPPSKVEGEVYVLPREFLLTMQDGKYARLFVGLVLKHGFSSAPQAAAKGAPVKPPPGFGALEQEAAVRAIVTETLTGKPATTLATARGRATIQRRLRAAVNAQTDVKVERVLFTDLVVQ
ncbi:hypothetical protein GKE82_18910 [Conexibacter sp. W3-3-2]|uniref:flagellar basal body-associated FliL family protein n=1 Tax=Conexibacter sp. W3-3-2 TaxID=2675227 RepID=UPI0012B72BDB|nr:flagellar basal body-associated FliL family protein [Conexibacter sp. W3-3-2]MTD46299.1 hypothetical protein [Conexibacter sp. W3-3-2]